MQINRITPLTSLYLDAIRWMAAFAVLLTHIDDKMLKPINETPDSAKSLFLIAWKLISDSGTEAVMVFFVVSGYLVGGAALAEFKRTGNLDLQRYLLRRASRLYTVLVPALLIGAALDLLGSGLSTQIADEVYGSRLEQLDLLTLLGNLAFVQEQLTPTFGTNDALWSLAFEAYYYLAFALFLAACSPHRSTAERLSFSALLLVISILVSPKILLLGTIWLLGAGLRMLTVSIRIPRLIAIAQLLGLLVLIRLFVEWEWKQSLPGYLLVSIAVSLSLSVLILSVQNHASENAYPSLVSRFHKHMAEFSYTLYATHLPLLTLIIALSEYRFQWGLSEIYESAIDISIYITIAIAITLYARLFYHFTESRTESVYLYLKRIIKSDSN